MHPEPYRTYNIDRNINYTNVCAAVCDFCAFYRKSNDADAYVLPREELYKKIEETIALGGDQILMQGGMHPSLKLEWYEELLRDLKTRYPKLNLHAFSPPEIWHFHKINKLPLREVLQRLKDAGLGSLPGGGGEILVDRVRKELTKGKSLTDEWLEVTSRLAPTRRPIDLHHDVRPHRDDRRADRTPRPAAAASGRDRRLHRVHLLDDAARPQDGPLPAGGAFEYLRTQAIARLYLDNIPNIQSSWVTQGAKIGQVALFFGANDMGSLMIEENVVASAGTVHYLTLEQIKNSIREAGLHPEAAERVLRVHRRSVALCIRPSEPRTRAAK